MISLDISYTPNDSEYYTVIPWRKTLDDADLEYNRFWW